MDLCAIPAGRGCICMEDSSLQLSSTLRLSGAILFQEVNFLKRQEQKHPSLKINQLLCKGLAFPCQVSVTGRENSLVLASSHKEVHI